MATAKFTPGAFPNALPVVRYEVDASDALVSVNDAWQTFAIANGAPQLMRERILGRSIWDFVSDDTTRLVYDIILRQVRSGGRSRFEYRCDSPDRRRRMEMRIVPGRAGHVVFESATISVEWHREPAIAAAVTLVRCCGWCKRAHTDAHGWVELTPDGLQNSAPGAARTPVITNGMCADCYSRVMNSIDDSGIPAPRLAPLAETGQPATHTRSTAVHGVSRRPRVRRAAVV